MKKRFLYGTALFFLAILVTLVVWQGSFSMGGLGPTSVAETFVFWAVSTLVFILMVTLAWMLVRTGVKLWVERRKGREGSRFQSKLVVGALALSFLPVIFLFVFSVSVLGHNINKWFSRPTVAIQRQLIGVSVTFESQFRDKLAAQARWLAADEGIREWAFTGVRPRGWDLKFCEANRLSAVWLETASGAIEVCPGTPGSFEGTAAVETVAGARVRIRAPLPMDLAATRESIESEIREYSKLDARKKDARFVYILLLLLISLFILYVATWIALFLSRQISVPIAALVEAASRLRSGHLDHRIEIRAIDELGTLVRAFNEMASELEANGKELERRRNFTETILESIPTGVISLSGDRRIQKVNKALATMFGDHLSRAVRLEDIFLPEDAREMHYLLNRARRTGVASAQLDIERERKVWHLSVTVAALSGAQPGDGWVVVIEDTSELLRAQKSAAWHEVARRLAHEIKNPLTPIALSAERIARHLGRGAAVQSPEALRILRQCSATISAEVESVKTLVDEFSQLARFPAAQPVPADLNETVDSALAVFADRLGGIELRTRMASDLPAVAIDREQFKRVVVNLIDNAAEAMQDSPVKVLTVSTQAAAPDSVELSVTDTGHGISSEDRDRLFLPYFSTKGRGTGLGLAIVHHILTDHGARIRVEDNAPCGARFVIEIGAWQGAQPGRAAGSAA